MAQQLLDAFPKNAECLAMTVENFDNAKIIGEEITISRLKKMQVISDSELKKIAGQISETGMVTYQEGFQEALFKGIEEEFF